MAGSGHRSTLKQKNKSHNHGKHRSKRHLKREAHGKVNVKTATKNRFKIKEALRQEALANQLSGRDDFLNGRRKTISQPPKLVVLVSLNKSVDTPAVLDLLKKAELTSEIRESPEGIIHVSDGKLKQRLSFILPQYGDLQSLLDSAKAADIILFLLSADSGIDDYGDHCLSCLIGQGLASQIVACQGLSNLTKKKRQDAKKRIDKQVSKCFSNDDKLRALDTWQDAQNMWRSLVNINPKTIHFREHRPYLLAEHLDYIESSDESDKCIVKLTGYLRGRSLNVNQLVHLPGWGDFQMSQIDEVNDPNPIVLKGKKDRRGSKSGADDTEMLEVEPSSFCLAKATNPVSLESENIPDEMDQEQTWPTEDELKASELETKTRKEKMLKGVSEYQSNWILDDDDDDEEEDDESDEDMKDDDSISSDKDELSDLDDADESQNDDADNYDEGMDLDEEKKMFEKMKEEKLNVHFPDEIDTPLDVTARQRFARYRGMDSFHKTIWDINDNLPVDYARIDRVRKSQFKRLRKLCVENSEMEADGDNLPAEVGTYITVFVKDVPVSFKENHSKGSTVVLYGLFSNEHRMTLISAAISRAPEFKAPVKSKEPLIFQIGFRRFSSRPVFSEQANQNKFKMERFLPASAFIVASMYAPVMFAPAPVLVFRENVLGKHDLVAKGSLEPLNTDRIVVKRVVLSGAPFKVNKRSVVVRYMFFNREDIDYFKPIELRTKYGKRGHIKQALGTHGHMKCTFNGQLKSEDTILMNLYKRVFPKWTYNPCVYILPPVIDEENETNEMENDLVEEEKGDAYKLFD